MITFLRETKPGKAPIEIHMENIIKSCRNLWMGYKRWLLQVHILLKELEQEANLSVIEGDSFVRFKSNIDNAGLNSLFFIYEIGNVLPTLTWRHLIGAGHSFNYVLLARPISCLPAFSFSLDRQTTLLYWGENVPFLSTIYLKNLNLRNFVLKANNPSSVEVSAANIMWPKSAYPLMNQELERLMPYYIFNSLMPPILNDVGEVWSEAPLVLIGDKTIRLLTIHKTICTIDVKNTRTFTDRNVVNTRATLIDRSFTVKHVYLDISEEYFDQLVRRESPQEVIFIKDAKFSYDPTMSMQRPYIRYMIYPFESIKLFSEESYGLPLSIVSMVLREYYLKSNDPFLFTLTPEEFKKCLVRILSPFPHSQINELGLRLIESRKGLSALASLLRVYVSDGSIFSYLHPALFECFITTLKDRIEKNYLVGLQRIASRYIQESEPSRIISNVLLIQKLFEEELNSTLSYTKAERLIVPLHTFAKVCIPLSKALCMRSWGQAS